MDLPQASSPSDAPQWPDLSPFVKLFRCDPFDPIAMTTPPPGTGQPVQTTGYQYDYAGRVTVVSHPDGTTLSNQYEPTGLLSSRAGARSYPVEYRYDAQGRMTNLITWQDHAQDAGRAVTRWEYDSKRGFLVRKTYADTNSFILYTNTPAGRLHSRTWARGITTTYTTNAAGETIGIAYSDVTTPGVTYNLDRLGRHTNVVDGAGSRFLTYDEDGGLLSVTNASGVLAGLKVEYAYDSIGRRTNTLFFTNNAAAVLAHGYTYDAASRLSAVSDGTYSAAYSYLANSSLIDSISYDDGPNTRMTAPRTYDHLGRLQRIAATPTSGLGWDFDYTYNQANQRVRTAHRDGSAWQYDYDGLGQLSSGKKHWTDGTPVPGQQREYAYDDIGNRLSTAEGGDALGTGLREAMYGPNLLNQYTNRTAPEALDVIGIANAQAETTVNGQAPTRKGEYYWREVAIGNGSGPDYVAITNQAVLSGQTNTTSGHILVGPAEESFTYDADGNLLTDGLWDYTWDGENRLVEMKSDAGVPTEAVRWLVFAYDSQGRRISKCVSNWNGGWSLEGERTFAYDDWNLLAELDGEDNVLRSFLWGSDLSASMQGAGGVGGLLAVDDSEEGCHFAAYDGNGNVVGLVDATDGSPSAFYEYDPFGQRIRYTGTAASINPFQFSTKYLDPETGFSYYGHRFYNPSTGRWLSRDPIGEKGGVNEYAFVGNATQEKVDPFGTSQMRVTDLGQRQPQGNRLGETELVTWLISTVVETCPRTRCEHTVRIRACWATVEYWWSDPVARAHEEGHAFLWQTAWDDALNSMSPFLGQCTSKRKALCLQKAAKLYEEAYMNDGAANNWEFDCAVGSYLPTSCVNASHFRGVSLFKFNEASRKEAECAAMQ